MSHHVDDVIAGLERVRKSLCAYEGPTCDCKGGFGVDVRPGTEATGCVELRRAGALLRGVAKALDGALVMYPAEKAEVEAFVERTFAPTADAEACGHYFHASTSYGWCPQCGGQWKGRHRQRDTGGSNGTS